MKLLSIVVVAVLLACALPVIRALRAYRQERQAFASRRWQVPAPPDSGSLGINDVSFVSSDGHRIRGWYLPSRNGAVVVLCHGSQADRSSMLDVGRELAHGGFGVLMFDWPGQGESEGRVELGGAERNALVAALEFVSHRADVRPESIGAFGVSAGSYTVISVAAADQRIRAVAVAGAFGNAADQLRAEYSFAGRLAIWAARLAVRRSGFDFNARTPLDVVGQIAPRPLVIVAGSADRSTPPALGKRLFDAAGEPKQFWLIQGAGHTGYSDADPTYFHRLRAFFETALLRASGSEKSQDGPKASEGVL